MTSWRQSSELLKSSELCQTRRLLDRSGWPTMRAIVTIPTYWTWPQGTPPRPSDAIFDHPTPVDGISTLPRLLDSLLAAQRGLPFDVLVVVGVVDMALGARAEARVREILAAYGDPIRVGHTAPDMSRPTPSWLFVPPADIVSLGKALERAGFPPETLSPHTYPGIRNVHLIIPYLLGYDLVIALDDDESIPPDYFRRVQEALDANTSGGIAGLYLDTRGDPYLPTASRTGNIFLDKAHWMNDALRDVLRADARWVSTLVGFGGNMVVSRSLIQRVGFDPYITRGEDIDYILNAALVGVKFVLDRELYITHMPPRQYDVHPYAKLAQDVRRFLYEREKLRLARSERGEWEIMEELFRSPYPGRFLADDVEEHALVALRALADEDAIHLWGTPEAIVEQAVERARALAPHYTAFASTWNTLISNLQYPISNTQYPTFDTQP